VLFKEIVDVTLTKEDLLADLNKGKFTPFLELVQRPSADPQIFHNLGPFPKVFIRHGEIIPGFATPKKDLTRTFCYNMLKYAMGGLE
jgi:hypothetical protein